MHQSQQLNAPQEKSRSSADSFARSGEKLSRARSFKGNSTLFPGIISPQPLAQLKLRAKKSFVSSVTKNVDQQDDLDTIAELLVLYNQINPGGDLKFQKRLGALKALEEGVYLWFNFNATKKTDDVENAVFLKTFLSEIKQEHQSIVTQIASIPNAVPVDSSNLTKKETTKVRNIWNNLLKNSGNIEIRDDGNGFRDSMLAAFAKLLEGEFGRRMLTDLDKNRGGGEQKIIIGADFSQELGDDEEAKSEAIPRSRLDPQREKENKLLGSGSDNARTDLPTFNKKKENFSAEEFHDFIIGTDGKDKFKWGDEAFKKGKGTGSLVRIAPEGDYNLDEDGNQTLVPEYITLGHELGHAQRILRGASLQGEDIADVGVTDEAEKKLWTDVEEFVNINAVENRLRDEHGLSKRKLHAGDPDTVKFEKNLQAFSLQWDNWKTTIPVVSTALLKFHPLGLKLGNYTTVKPDFASDKVMKRIKKELTTLDPDAKNVSTMWQIAGQALRSDNSLMISMAYLMPKLLPHIDNGTLNGLKKEIIQSMVRYGCLQKNWSPADKVILWMRQQKNYSPLKQEIKTVVSKGGLIPFFRAGLTHQEFENDVDPNTEVNVELEYDSKIYVRKRFL